MMRLHLPTERVMVLTIKKDRIITIVFALLSLMWMMFIFSLSHDTATESSQMSQSITETIVEIIKPEIRTMKEPQKQSFIDSMEKIIRKLAHASVFMVLGILVSITLISYVKNSAFVLVSGFAFCVFYAITDEVHQLFVQGRSGEMRDVLIDSAGSLLGMVLVFLSIYIFKKVKYRLKHS